MRKPMNAPVVSSKMELDHGSQPLLADVVWRLRGNGPNALRAEVRLQESGEMLFTASFGSCDGVEYFSTTRDRLAAFAQGLTALVAQVDADHADARRRLATWRARHEESLEPLA